MHRARCPTRSESLGRITVLLGVSGRAFCAVTTLPPPEQAAVESKEQLAGHQATAQPLSTQKEPERWTLTGQLLCFPFSACNPTLIWCCSTCWWVIPSWCAWDCCQSPPASAAFGVSSRWRLCCTTQSTAPPTGRRQNYRGFHTFPWKRTWTWITRRTRRGDGL